MNEQLDQLYIKLRDFEKKVTSLKEQHPMEYDLYLHMPAWRKNNIEDYATELSADIAKFKTHFDMLQQTDALIQNVTINRDVLSRVSARLIDYVDLYQTELKSNVEKNLCEQLIQLLNQTDALVKTISDSSPGKPSPHL